MCSNDFPPPPLPPIFLAWLVILAAVLGAFATYKLFFQ